MKFQIVAKLCFVNEYKNLCSVLSINSDMSLANSIWSYLFFRSLNKLFILCCYTLHVSEKLLLSNLLEKAYICLCLFLFLFHKRDNTFD